MDVLSCNLEAIKTSGFGYCHFGGKVFAEVFVINSIGDGKECEDMRNKASFIVV